MQYTINQFRREAFKEVYQVYRVFQDFFGENAVDLQGIPDDKNIEECFQQYDIEESEYEHVYNMSDQQLLSATAHYENTHPFILVHWPRVKITNEHDRHITIQDLYAKINLDTKGNIPTEDTGFLLNRATYPIEQWLCRYLHSHTPPICYNTPEEFKRPCLGSGPIRETINSLRAAISEGYDETKWMLFCHELSLYVTVESLQGVPYMYLENVNLNDQLSEFGGYDTGYNNDTYRRFYRAFAPETLKDFIIYYLHKGHLAVNYQNGMFKVGMSYFDYIVDISNSFIEYFNTHFNDALLAKKCFDCGILYRCVAANDKFYNLRSRNGLPDVSSYEGRKICTFKGMDVKLHILNTPEEEEVTETIILYHGLAMYILNNILKIINYRYTNEYTRQHCQDSTAALPATTGQRVYYI